MPQERRPQRPDRAAKPAKAGTRPPLMLRRAPRPRKPRLPEGQRPFIDKSAMSDLRGAVKEGEFDDAVKAYALAGDAMNADEPAKAIELLEWVKSVASRSAAVREALGIAYYLQGDFAKAHSELLAYRRMSNRRDQNHVLADCSRAAERHDKVAEYVEEMIQDKTVPRDRAVEGLIVLAGDRADRGDLRGALDTLARAGLEPTRVEAWHPRLWYAAADLAARMGDVDMERQYLEAITAVAEDFLDVEERLAGLD